MIDDYTVEDFENLEGLSKEKLIKLLSVAKDYRVYLSHEMALTANRINAIIEELDKKEL